MIEVTLDRTLVAENPQKQDSQARVQKALEVFNAPLPFDQFINFLIEKTGRERSEIEDRFWELVDNGEIRLSSDFIVKKAA